MLFNKIVLVVSLILLSGFITSCSTHSVSDESLSDYSEHTNVQSLTKGEDIPVKEDSFSDSITEVENRGETEATIPPEPVVFIAEHSSGEFHTRYTGDYNDDLVIELEFSVKLEQTTCRRSDAITLSSSVKNIGSPFMYTPDYGAPATWIERIDYINGKNSSSGYARYCIYYEDYPIPEGIPEEELCETGDTWNQSVKIKIPSNAILGTYDIKIYSHGYSAIVKNAIEIVNE